LKYYKHWILMVLFIAIFVFSNNNASLTNVSVTAGDVSQNNMAAPKSLTYIDENDTERLKQDVLSKVQNAYELDKNVYQNAYSEWDLFIQAILDLKLKSDQKIIDTKTDKLFNFNLYIQQEIKRIPNPYKMTSNELMFLFNTSKDDLLRLKDIYGNELEKIFSRGLTNDNVEQAKKEFSENSEFYYFTRLLRQSITLKLTDKIVPNLILNLDTTEQMKKDALAKVQPVFKTIKKDEMIIRKGEVFSAAQIDKLTRIGLIRNEINYWGSTNQVPLISFLTLILFLGCVKNYDQFRLTKRFGILLTFILLTLIITDLIKGSSFVFVPYIFFIMLVTFLWGQRFTIFSSIILSLFMSFVIGNDFIYLSMCIISGLLFSLLFDVTSKRTIFFKSSFILGIGMSILYLCTTLVQNEKLSIADFQFSLYLILSCFIASILAIGMLPLAEPILGIVSSFKLYELSKPDHPLITRLIFEAPGTYYHSLMVGNLAELAAEKIGANGLLLRVGATFHDVGKLKNPLYFIENSTLVTNPHLNIEPLESARIILEHPSESVRLCLEHHIPAPIIKLIHSHHGDSILYHLYQKEKEKNADVNIKDFQYKTPTPKTKEEGILLLADSTEAYARHLLEKQLSKEEFAINIKEMILKRVQLGDLKDCELTFKDLNVIVETFIQYFSSSMHKRISYTNE
jgi:putative nucleotidyltransferase with HDIG domain